jgi:membrane protease YdiL (CAAX protease family)
MQPMTRSQILLVLGVTAIVLLGIAKTWTYFGGVQVLRVFWNPVDALWGVGLAVAITIASTVIYTFWDDYRKSADYYLDLILRPLALPDLIWIGLLPGLSEELLFRGVMLPQFGLDWVGVVLSSLFFGVMHLSSLKQWSYVMWAAFIGGVFAWSALISGNLLVPIVAHVFTNLISAIVWKIRQFNTAA